MPRKRWTKAEAVLAAFTFLITIGFGPRAFAGGGAAEVSALRLVTDSVTGDFLPSLLKYQPKMPREFSNGAIVDTRWSLLEGGSLSVSSEGELQFPDGTVISKRFSYRLSKDAVLRDASCLTREFSMSGAYQTEDEQGDAKLCPVELRVLLKSRGAWKSTVYVWLDERWVASPAGMLIPIHLGGGEASRAQRIDYSVPSLGECVTCHLGSRSAQRFGPVGMTKHRLSPKSFREIAGISSTTERPGIAELVDRKKNSVEARARAYLHANCGFCHNQNGLAASSGLMLDADENDSYRLGVCKRPVAFGGDEIAGQFDVEPGHPERSIMLFRMASLKAGVAMPELGRSVLDGEGISLVARWIAGMKGDCED